MLEMLLDVQFAHFLSHHAATKPAISLHNAVKLLDGSDAKAAAREILTE